jgi:peptidoglycan DL-endopeptidase CwlO
MTRTTTDHTSRTARTARTNRRRLAIGLVSATAALTMLAPNSASATARVASSDVAGSAAAAVQALETWQASGSLVDYAAYLKLRSRTASLTASAMGMPTESLRTAWGTAPMRNQHAMLAAISQLGVPYRSMASEEGAGFDCSGLMLYAYRRAGVELPRNSRDQFNAGKQVDPIAAQPGDVVFYPGHISMYIGFGLMVNSPNSGSSVEVRLLPERSLSYADVTDL